MCPLSGCLVTWGISHSIPEPHSVLEPELNNLLGGTLYNVTLTVALRI